MRTRRRSAAVALALAALASSLVTVSVAPLAHAAPAVAPTAAAAVDSTGTYYQVAQQRLLDTRTGLGAPKRAVPFGTTVTFQVTGRAGIPASGVSAVVLNLTAVAPSRAGYVTAYPAGGARPNASSLNLPAGATRANLVTVPVGVGTAAGQVSLYNGAGTDNLVADVLGFYTADDSLQPSLGMGRQFQLVAPSRIFDSRLDRAGALAGGEVVTIGADFGPSVNSTVRALAVNVTATAPTGAGYLQVYPGNVSTPPTASSLNFAAGQTVPNMVVATTSYDAQVGVPAIRVRNSPAARVQVIVDVVGYYDQDAAHGLRYRAITPTRIIDTRTGAGGVKAPLPPSASRRYVAPSTVADQGTLALVANTTVDGPTATTYLTVWDGTSTRPTVSNLNATARQVVANATVVPLDTSKAFSIYNSNGSTPTIVDVSGSFEQYPATTAASPGSGATARHAPAVVRGRVIERSRPGTASPGDANR